MRILPSLRIRIFALGLTAALVLPGTSGHANDSDLFRADVPPNILLLVDNSSSMRIQVHHQDYGKLLPDNTKAKNQTDCEYFRNTIGMGSGKFTVKIEARLEAYFDGDGTRIRWHNNVSPSAWQLDFPVRDPAGNPMFNDLDADGVQDAGELDMYYRFPDPTSSDPDWDADTNNQATPVKDFQGNHLFYDVDGDGNLETADGDRLLYYWYNNSGGIKGAKAKIAARVTPVDKALAAGIHPLTLEITNNNICGVDATGWFLYDGDDPESADRNGNVLNLQAQYLDWLFSNYGNDARAATFQPAVGNDGIRTKTSCITLASGESSTYETYRRSRIQALKLILRTVICEVNQVGNVRFGYAQFRFAGKGGDDNGGYVVAPVEDWYESDGVTLKSYTLHGISDTHENHLRRIIAGTAPDAQTPLAESLFQIYTYFMPRTAAEMPKGRDWLGVENTEVFPVYNYDMSVYDPFKDYDPDVDAFPPNLDLVGGRFVGVDPDSTTEDADASAAPDPVLWSCQKNFILFITDGGSSGDDFTDNDDKINAFFNPTPLVETHTDRGFSRFVDLIGDHYRIDDGTSGGAPDETETTAGTGTRYMDDVAAFMNRWDFRPDLEGTQTIDLYTVGYSVDSVEGGDASNVEVAADRGNGLYFESADADELAADIITAITDMIEKAQAFTSATVPASRTTDGNNFYFSYFLPKEDSAFWEGHLKNYDFSLLGDILTADGFCATGDDIDATPPCSGGKLRTNAPAFWDTATAMPDPADRDLFFEEGSTSAFGQPPRWNASNIDALDVDIDLVDLLDQPFQDFVASLIDPMVPATFDTAKEAVADALVDSLAGCEFPANPGDACVIRTNDAGERRILGDIFHSNPIVVGSPNSPINESSYSAFATTHRERDRMIYVGANDGWLHGFHAGTWRTVDAGGNPLSPPRHDRGTGAEVFGFLPRTVRPEVKNLVTETTFPRPQTYADGSPVVADAWIYRDVSGGALTTVNPTLLVKDPAQWRTVLLTGLRDGGKNVSALDITSPDDPANGTFPGYLWTFPCSDCGAAGTLNPQTSGEATFVGKTWSDPVITRVRVRGDASANPGIYERWVAIFGAGYAPEGDPNSVEYQTPAMPGFKEEGRALYMVDITTGQVLAKKYWASSAVKIPAGTGTQIGFPEMQYAIASAPAVFDIDFDGFADVVYVGDLGGNVWKWVIRAPGDDPINNSSYNKNLAQPNWAFRLFFKGAASTDPPPEQESPAQPYDVTVHYQSFFFPPTGVLRKGTLVLAMGAGERNDPKGAAADYSDGDASNNNHFYVLKDSRPFEIYNASETVPDPLLDFRVESDLLDNAAIDIATCADVKANPYGYFITSRDAEKFITNSVIFFGDVFTGSYRPPDPGSTDRCDVSGEAFLWRFDLDCANGSFPSNPGTGNSDRYKAIGDGIPTRPRVSVGGINVGDQTGGCSSKVVVITSDGHISNDCPGTLSSTGVNVRTWRQR